MPPQDANQTPSFGGFGLKQRYGGVEGYVRAIGLSPEEIDTLRRAFVE